MFVTLFWAVNLYFISVVDVLAYKYVRLVVFTPIHGKMCSYIGLLILSFLQHSQPKTKTGGEGGGMFPSLFYAEALKKRKEKKTKENSFLSFPDTAFPQTHRDVSLHLSRVGGSTRRGLQFACVAGPGKNLHIYLVQRCTTVHKRVGKVGEAAVPKDVR